jgi:hypothetical protein
VGFNQLRLLDIFPDYQAQIIRQQADGGRELVMARIAAAARPGFRASPR